MNLRSLVVALFALLSLAVLQPARADDMARPLPIWVPPGLAAEQVRIAVGKALSGRGWEISDVAPGEIEGRLTRPNRDVRAAVRVRYDDRDVTIVYHDSEGLDYDPAAGTIDRQYNRWVRNLEKDIRTFLAREAL